LIEFLTKKDERVDALFHALSNGQSHAEISKFLLDTFSAADKQ